jgi:hypothetical protein
VGLLVPLARGTALVLVTFALGAAVSSRRAGILAAILIASCPLLLRFSRAATATPTSVVSPLLGEVPVTDGRGALEHYEGDGGWQQNTPAQPIAPETGRTWVGLSSELATTITRLSGPGPVVAFGFRHRLVNVNTVNLAQLIRVHAAFAVRMVDPVEFGAAVADYR